MQKFNVQGFLAGALLGVVFVAFSFVTKKFDELGASLNWWWLLPVGVLALLGGLMPIVARALLNGYRALLKSLGLTSIPVTLPFTGEVTLELGNPQRAAARKIFFEMATRTVTQPLSPKEGSIEVALKSCYTVFQVARDAITEMPPTLSNADPKIETLESTASRMLNSALRPYLTRWHPRLDRWIALGHDEADWPHAELCRLDLDRMRVAMTSYCYAMARAANVPRPEAILPPEPDADSVEDGDEVTAAFSGELDRLDGVAEEAPTLAQKQLALTLAGSLSSAGVGFQTEDDVFAGLRTVFATVGEVTPELITLNEGAKVSQLALGLHDDLESRATGSAGVGDDAKEWASWCASSARAIRDAATGDIAAALVHDGRF